MLSVAESHPSRSARSAETGCSSCIAPPSGARTPVGVRASRRARSAASWRGYCHVRADRLSRPARLVLAVDADEQEHQEADDGADDEAHGAAVADRRAADPDEEPEEERPGNEMTPWSNAGGRRCIAGAILDDVGPKKIHRAGCAFVHLPREPSASAYGPRERLRPTRAPCSVQEGRYTCAVDVQVAVGVGLLQFADNSVCAAPAGNSCRALERGPRKNSPSRLRFRPPSP